MNSYVTATPTSKNTSITPSETEEYTANSDAYFSTPNYIMLAKPPFANLLGSIDGDLTQRVKDSLRFAQELGHDHPVIVGAIPFKTNEVPLLRLFPSVHSSVKEERSTYNSLNRAVTNKIIIQRLTEEPDMHTFVCNVERALAIFECSTLEKVVLSRTLTVDAKYPFNIKNILSRLEKNNSKGYTFAVPLNDNTTDQGGEGTLLGASPELLISVRDGKVFTNPLAGSEPLSSSEQENDRLRTQLIQSPKDRYEHQLVVQEVARILAPFCQHLNVPNAPSIITTDTMMHLSTIIEGELKDTSTSVIDLALALHPTPAVCGFPKETAFETINNLENHNRESFTGIVGWCDAKGNGDWAVTIRCAKIQDRTAKLYAGAGIVKGSCPQKEWQETGGKFQTMLQAISLV